MSDTEAMNTLATVSWDTLLKAGFCIALVIGTFGAWLAACKWAGSE